MANTDLPDIEIVKPEDLQHWLDHLNQEPGSECVACHRPIPKKKSDDKPGPRRSVVSIHEPAGEEGTLEPLMIAVVDKYRDQWPHDAKAMERQIGVEVVGGRSWKYYVTHFSLYAVLMVPGLAPVEED